MTSTYAIDGVIGTDFTRRSTTTDFKLGDTAIGDENTAWVYVQASGAVATGTCTVGASFLVTDAAGDYTADTAFADGEYGWVRKNAAAF